MMNTFNGLCYVDIRMSYQHTKIIIFLTPVRADSNYQTKQRGQNKHPNSPIIPLTACLTSFIFQQYNIGFNVELK